MKPINHLLVIVIIVISYTGSNAQKLTLGGGMNYIQTARKCYNAMYEFNLKYRFDRNSITVYYSKLLLNDSKFGIGVSYLRNVSSGTKQKFDVGGQFYFMKGNFPYYIITEPTSGPHFVSKTFLYSLSSGYSYTYNINKFINLYQETYLGAAILSKEYYHSSVYSSKSNNIIRPILNIRAGISISLKQ